jgi:predicted ester cyclase
MLLNENKMLARRFIEEVVNGKQPAVADELLSKDAGDHFKESLTTLLILTAFPDALVQIERIIEEGGRVTVLSTMTGTHKGNFVGIAPTGKGVTVRRIDVFSVSEGKIVDILHNFDLVGLLPQIDAFPSGAVPRH